MRRDSSASARRSLSLLVAALATVILTPRLESQAPATQGPEPLFPILTAGRWGLIDRTGRVVVTPRFDELLSHETMVPPALVFMNSSPVMDRLIPVRLGRQWGFVGRSGELLIPPAFDAVRWFGEAPLAPAQIKGKYGYIDRDGRFAITPQFGSALSFACGLAQVTRGRKWGLIDTSGRFVAAPEFDDMSDPCYWALVYLRRSSNSLTLSLYDPEFYDRDLIGIMVRRKLGFLNRQGQIVIEPMFIPALWPSVAFRHGLYSARVRLEDKFGYIDSTGRFAIPPQFDSASNFVGGPAVVDVSGKYGYIDPQGRFIVEPSLERNPPYFYGSALTTIRVSGKTGFIDRKGTIAIPPRFDRAGRFSEGLAAVVIDGKAGFIDERGAVVIETKFDASRSFAEGRAAVCVGNLWGFVDRSGRYVVEPRFQEVNDFNQGLALVTDGTRASYLDLDGQVVYTTELPGLAAIRRGPCAVSQARPEVR